MSDRNPHVKIVDRVSTRLKLKQLRLLVAIAEHSSILHAAEDIHISQPAATKLLKDLEADFNVRLFDRTNRGVIPTVYGDAFVRHGKLILAQLSHAAQELDDLNRGRGGRVIVGTLLTASVKLLPTVIAQIHAERPNVSIIVRDGTNDLLMPLLHSGELDLVVGRLTEFRHRKEFTQEILYHENVEIICHKNHRLAKAKRVDFKTLAKQDWILPSEQTTLRRQIEKEFFDRGLPAPNCPVESASFLTNRTILANTDMIGVFPSHVFEQELKTGELGTINCKLNIGESPVGVSYRREASLSPAVAAFLARLRQLSV